MLRMTWSRTALLVSVGWMGLGCEDVELQMEEDVVASTVQGIRGPDTQWEERMTSGYSSATPALKYSTPEPPGTYAIGCSGVLVNPVKVITALHCINPALDHVFFPQNGGFSSPIIDKVWPDGEEPGVPSGWWPHWKDIAILTLGTPIPRWIAEPMPIRLDDDTDLFGTAAEKALVAGWGGSVSYDSEDGSGYRRTGTVWGLSWTPESIPVMGGMWRSSSTLFAGPSPGDSGGGLFHVGAQVELVGIASGHYSDDDPESGFSVSSYWAPIGGHGEAWRSFLSENLAWTPSIALPEFGLADLAIYGTHDITLNDRVRVMNPNGSFANVAAGGHSGIHIDYAYSNIGADAEVGNMWVNDNLGMRARSRARHLVVEGRIIAQNGASASSLIEHRVSAMPPLGLPPWPSSAPVYPDITLQPETTMTLGNADSVRVHGRLVVNRAARLILTPSAVPYYFDNVTVETGGIIEVNTQSAPQRIFVRDNLVFRGELRDSDITTRGDVLIGIHGNQSVTIGAPLVGTVVAPNAWEVILDANGAVFEGAYMGKKVTVHQGSQVTHRPFPGTWW